MARRSTAYRGRAGNPAATMMLVRQWHAYLTAFVAPTILFFAFTGALQLFSLHEAHGGYRPPALIEKLGRLHKDQVFAIKAERTPKRFPARAGEQSAAAKGDWVQPIGVGEVKAAHLKEDDAQPIKVTALKWLFLGAAIMLIVSTLLGLWMAVTQNRRKIILLVLLILGAAAPTVMLILL